MNLSGRICLAQIIKLLAPNLKIDSNGIPTHAARQLANGKWTSKLGWLEDIEHELDGLTGDRYGVVGQILKRAVN
ncbi:MAG: hypothetical protein EAZ69_10585 [Oscillatoriales cyanobacterium]|nr:MAG: hypothetical protein EAZ69_10585 [Oscillatoriales cyanobacterium]